MVALHSLSWVRLPRFDDRPSVFLDNSKNLHRWGGHVALSSTGPSHFLQRLCSQKPSLQPVPGAISTRDDPLRIGKEDLEVEQNLSDYESGKNDEHGEDDQRNGIGPPLSSTQIAEFDGNPDLTRYRTFERISIRNLSAALRATHFTLREVINELISLR